MEDASKNPTRQALFHSLKETFTLGVEELSKTLTSTLRTSKKDSAGQTISFEQQQWEQYVTKQRT